MLYNNHGTERYKGKCNIICRYKLGLSAIHVIKEPETKVWRNKPDETLAKLQLKNKYSSSFLTSLLYFAHTGHFPFAFLVLLYL